MDAIILGAGRLGSAIEAELRIRGDRPLVVGRPSAGGHPPAIFDRMSVAFDASRGDAVLANVRAGLAGGCRRFVIGTTGWDGDRDAVDPVLLDAGAAAVAAPNLSLGAALFLRLVEVAAGLYGSAGGFDPYVLEWHRRGKLDRPSGTARELVRRLGASEKDVVAVRAGSSPGMHLVAFDAPGETVELRLTARDRSAYAAGALAAADWLVREPRAPGLHAFDRVVEELLAADRLAAIA